MGISEFSIPLELPVLQSGKFLEYSSSIWKTRPKNPLKGIWFSLQNDSWSSWSLCTSCDSRLGAVLRTITQKTKVSTKTQLSGPCLLEAFRWIFPLQRDSSGWGMQLLGTKDFLTVSFLSFFFFVFFGCWHTCKKCKLKYKLPNKKTSIWYFSHVPYTFPNVRCSLCKTCNGSFTSTQV